MPSEILAPGRLYPLGSGLFALLDERQQVGFMPPGIFTGPVFEGV